MTTEVSLEDVVGVTQDKIIFQERVYEKERVEAKMRRKEKHNVYGRWPSDTNLQFSRFASRQRT